MKIGFRIWVLVEACKGEAFILYGVIRSLTMEKCFAPTSPSVSTLRGRHHSTVLSGVPA
ncbi:hypothetical protein ISS30_03760 [bacterium]|nr:hypothetical protein [bacterium]